MQRLLTRLSKADWFPIVVLIALSVLQFGWIVFPTIGTLIGLISNTIILGIFAAAAIGRLMAPREPNQ